MQILPFDAPGPMKLASRAKPCDDPWLSQPKHRWSHDDRWRTGCDLGSLKVPMQAMQGPMAAAGDSVTLDDHCFLDNIRGRASYTDSDSETWAGSWLSSRSAADEARKVRHTQAITRYRPHLQRAFAGGPV